MEKIEHEHLLELVEGLSGLLIDQETFVSIAQESVQQFKRDVTTSFTLDNDIILYGNDKKTGTFFSITFYGDIALYLRYKVNKDSDNTSNPDLLAQDIYDRILTHYYLGYCQSKKNETIDSRVVFEEKMQNYISEAANGVMKFADEEIKKRENDSNSKEGCYIATAVYGTYNCPQLWIFRRFRDDYLAKHIWGRLFIKIYYATSPSLVKIIGDKKCFSLLGKKYLDRLATRLYEKGYTNTPYKDK